MAAELAFGLLGPLEVRRDTMPVPIAAGKQRALLAVLLLNAGTVVPVDELVEALWGSGPPASARASLHNYVKRLRNALADAARDRIATRPQGYLIRAEPGELDVSRFEELLEDARTAAQESAWQDAASRARAALALWRGEPLADTGSDVLVLREAPRLAEMRLRALELAIDAGLHLGRHAELVGELRRLVAEHPLRERLHGLLMLALYRDGRQGEALVAYRDTRRMLVADLGAEPGPELQELHQKMLTADAGLVGAETVPALLAQPAIPRLLPALVPHFVGRSGDLAQLEALLAAPQRDAPGLAVIGGMAGVGKTALAVHWAHRAAKRFPDGQLYVNLCGYDPGQPMSPADALTAFLRTLGVPGRDIPSVAEECAALYRSLLAGRRVLVVLDNAGSAEQVRPLLPGSHTCAVVVTSRDSLAGLVARDGATRLDLSPLPIAEAADLLRTLIGRRAGDDPQAVVMMARQCSHLPLALRVAAELAAARPSAALAQLTRELADQQHRLDMLDASGDPRTAVRAVFSWSYRNLDTDAARAFRLLGLRSGLDLDCYAAAALTGGTVQSARHLLDRLVRAHLVQPTEPDRYGMHELLRAYAQELGTRLDTEAARREALTRLFDYYLDTAAAAMDTLYPAERHRRPHIPRGTDCVHPVADAETARAWLDAERATLVTVTEQGARHGWPGHAAKLAAILFRYLDTGSHHPEAIAIYTHARQAARQSGDASAEATALIGLGVIDARQGRRQQASEHLRQALALHVSSGDRVGQAVILANLGIIDILQGSYRQATEHLGQALGLAREAGDRSSQARALSYLSLVRQRQGHYEQATEHLAEALALARATGNRVSEAYALAHLGGVEMRTTSYRRAPGHIRQALALFRETGERAGEGHALHLLGDTTARQGDYRQAVSHLQQALSLYLQTSEPAGQAEVRNSLGEAFLDAGDLGGARVQFAAALSLASQIDDKYLQARSCEGLARSHEAAGEADLAQDHWQRALARYSRLELPDADRIRTQLAAASAEPRRTGNSRGEAHEPAAAVRRS